MYHKIALVGCPNVGKSTLFNRLTKTNAALVADYPGLTRDRHYGELIVDDQKITVIDTGGFGMENLLIDKLSLIQLEKALNEVQLVLWVVDAKLGLTASDNEFASFIRKKDLPVFLVINKIDGLNEEQAAAEFQSLGFKYCYPIAAAHNWGISHLCQKIKQYLCSKQFENISSIPIVSPETWHQNVIKIALIGKPNVGKSTLINHLLNEERMIVSDIPGTTHDSISIPLIYKDKPYCFVDTAGIRKRARIHEKIEKFSVSKTLATLKKVDVALLMIDAEHGLTEQDKNLINQIIKMGRALVVAVNKWDTVPSDEQKKLKEDIAHELYFSNFARIHFISALYNKGIWRLFKTINEAFDATNTSIGTAKLTKFLGEIVSAHPPPLINSRRIKLKYAHLGGHNPPLIVIHGNQLEKVPAIYKKYLLRAFRDKLGLVGTPLKLEFKSSANPYIKSRPSAKSKISTKK